MTINLGEWTPDCGGDWCLSGPRWFANYWPDNTVSASIYEGEDGDGQLTDEVARSGIMSGVSKADCMAKAEDWIRAQLAAFTEYGIRWASDYVEGAESLEQAKAIVQLVAIRAAAKRSAAIEPAPEVVSRTVSPWRKVEEA